MPDPDPERNRISVRSRATGSNVILAVRDNGVGMDSETLERIFDPFFTTREPGEGSGLGLYLCHKFVESFGGSINAVSRRGEGTTFTISLRRATPEAEVQQLPEPLHVGSILIIDDEPLVARSLARALQGVKVTTVGSTREALEACRREQFGLILCDLMMPGEWGADFYAALQEEYPDRLKTVVFMTGGAFTPAARAFIDEASVPCLTKPIDREALFKAIRLSGEDS